MSRMYGVVVGTVKDVEDPQGEGRIQVEFPWMEGSVRSYWAPQATPMSGGQRGMWFRPEVGDEVLVAFDHGDVNHPYVIGFLWNGQDRPPTDDHDLRLIQTPGGYRIEIYDPDAGLGYVRIQDAVGNQIEMSSASINIRSVGMIEIQAPTVTINGRIVAPQPRPI